jgi:hypothetical protein
MAKYTKSIKNVRKVRGLDAAQTTRSASTISDAM